MVFADNKTLLNSGSITGSMVWAGNPPGSDTKTFAISNGDTLEWSLNAPTGIMAACNVDIYSPSGAHIVGQGTDHSGTKYSFSVTSYGTYTLKVTAPGSFTVQQANSTLTYVFSYSIYQTIVSTTPIIPSTTPKPTTSPTIPVVTPTTSSIAPGTTTPVVIALPIISSTTPKTSYANPAVIPQAPQSTPSSSLGGELMAAMVLIIGVMITIFYLNIKARQRNTYYGEPHDENDGDTYIYVNGNPQDPPQKPKSSFQRGMDWHVPKVNQRGADFITGMNSQQRRSNFSGGTSNRSSQSRLCPRCGGTGRVQASIPIAAVQGIKYTCSVCHGSGRV